MTDLIVELSKYLMTLLFAFYTYECFSSFRGKLTPEKRAKIFKRQMCLMYLIHLDAVSGNYAVTDDIRMILILCGAGGVYCRHNFQLPPGVRKGFRAFDQQYVHAVNDRVYYDYKAFL